MNQSKVAITLGKTEGQIAVIAIRGELTSFAEAMLSNALAEATQAGARDIIFDFRDLSYMNSSGIGLLVTSLVRASRQGQRLVAVELNEHYRQIFELTRLNEVIQLYPTATEALATLSLNSPHQPAGGFQR